MQETSNGIKAKPKLFVIEDDLDLQELIRSYFLERDFDVDTFGDATEALAVLNNNPAACDVLLTDFKLPDLSGIEVIRKLHANGTTAPIILMTAYHKSEMAIEAIKVGAYDFVVKPIYFPQLQVSVERALYLNRVHAENAELKRTLNDNSEQQIDGIIGRSPKFLQVLSLVNRVADSSANVFITGESGTGKEVIANAIHRLGKRKDFPFIAINCSAIPENLLESELFGHTKGSFTGAAGYKIGLLEEAHKGTLFLDEIGDLSVPLQAKLLRTLQEKKIKRIGENHFRPVDIRIVSATHKNLRREILANNFREDLFYRLNVIPINIPPLRDRPEDILPLAEFFLKKYAALNGASSIRFTTDVCDFLMRNPWRGNVRELENVVERAVVLTGEGDISLANINLHDGLNELDHAFSSAPINNPVIGSSASPATESGSEKFVVAMEGILPLETIISRYIAFAININKGAKDRTARDLGIDRKTLYRKFHQTQVETLPTTFKGLAKTIN